ncbi:MAG: hypothetical protein M3259_12690 [Actinomycetota bacterium]|nr:hypothetical protein [Actinomycetota bacterium]
MPVVSFDAISYVGLTRMGFWRFLVDTAVGMVSACFFSTTILASTPRIHDAAARPNWLIIGGVVDAAAVRRPR